MRYVDFFDEPAFVNDSKRRVLAVNQAYLDFFGLESVEEIEGLKWKNLLSEEDFRRYVNSFRAFCSSESEDFFREKVWVKTPTGKRCIEVIIKRVPPILEGQTRGYCGSFLDVTDVEGALDVVFQMQKSL